MKINLLVIRSVNAKELSEFYELLGIKFEYHCHGNGPWHYSSIINQLVFEIYPTKKPDNNTLGVRLGFEVDKLELVLEKINRSRGQKIKAPFESEFGRIAVVQDPEGRKIELKELAK